MEHLILLYSPLIIFLFICWLLKRNDKNEVPVNPIKPKPYRRGRRNTKPTLKPNSPKKRTPRPVTISNIRLTDDEIRQQFEEKFKYTDFEASAVTLINKNITHCPICGTVVFSANVVYNAAWYEHIKCCPQCSHTFIEEPTQKTIDFRDNKTILWVCKYQQTCNQWKHITTTATGILFRGDTIPFGRAEVAVQYCYACNEYFITEEQFRQYQIKHPHLLGNFVFVSSLQNRGISLALKDKVSKLYMNGYNVSQKTNLEKEDRWRILAYIIQ